MKKQIGAALATVATISGTTLFTATPASAELTTRCVGEGGAVTVPGDLVVPRGGSCTLTGTTVTGDVRVGPGADLIAEDVSVGGNVAVARDGYFEAFTSTVDGATVLRGAHGAYLEGTELGGRVATLPDDASGIGGFVYTFESELADDLVSRSAELFVDTSEVGGNVNSVSSQYADLYESFVDGGVSVRNNELGGVVCSSAVQGESRFVDNGDAVQLGAEGPFANCRGGSYWGADVTVAFTTGGVFADNNVVDGNLTLRDNDPVALVGPNNVIRGDIIGEFEDWDGTEPARAQRSAGGSAADSRESALQNRIDRRHDSAVASADRAGNAGLGR
jgi:hypothetical protein